MPSPATTGRTFWFNASTNAKLWSGTTPDSGVNPADGAAVGAWDDEDAGTEYFNSTTNQPMWRSNGINGLGAVDFNGSNDIMTGQGAGATLSNVISAAAATAFVAFSLDAAQTAGSNLLIGDDAGTGGSFALLVINTAGVHEVVIYNFGANETLSMPVSLTTPYVVMARHEGGALYLSVNRVAEITIASGDTTTLTNPMKLGAYAAANFFNGRIGEILMYNTALTGADLTDTFQYMTDKWVPQPVGAQLGAMPARGRVRWP